MLLRWWLCVHKAQAFLPILEYVCVSLRPIDFSEMTKPEIMQIRNVQSRESRKDAQLDASPA